MPFCRWVSELLAGYMQWDECTPKSGRSVNEPKPSTAAAPKIKPQASAVARGSSSNGSDNTAPSRPRLPCLKCSALDHSVRFCPKAELGEAAELIAAARERRRVGGSNAAPCVRPVVVDERKQSDPDVSAGAQGHNHRKGGSQHGASGLVSATIGGLSVASVLLDSGADTTLVSRGIVDSLTAHGPALEVFLPSTPLRPRPVGGGTIDAHRRVRLPLVRLSTSIGPLVLRNMWCWVDESDSDMLLTIGRPEMSLLGYSADSLLVAALAGQLEYEPEPQTRDDGQSHYAKVSTHPARPVLRHT